MEPIIIPKNTFSGKVQAVVDKMVLVNTAAQQKKFSLGLSSYLLDSHSVEISNAIIPGAKCTLRIKKTEGNWSEVLIIIVDTSRKRLLSEVSIVSEDKAVIEVGAFVRFHIGPLHSALGLISVRVLNAKRPNRDTFIGMHVTDFVSEHVEYASGTTVSDLVEEGRIDHGRIVEIDEGGKKHRVYIQPRTPSDAVKQTFIYGVVDKVVDEGLVVWLSRHERGLVFITDLSEDISVLEKVEREKDHRQRLKLLNLSPLQIVSIHRQSSPSKKRLYTPISLSK